jgi:hypothetical protein
MNTLLCGLFALAVVFPVPAAGFTSSDKDFLCRHVSSAFGVNEVVKAVTMYRQIFGSAPSGMWPGERVLAQPVLEILRENGRVWSATDDKNLKRSAPRANPTPLPPPRKGTRA